MPGLLNLPGHLTPDRFLAECWQKTPLPMPGALHALKPSISRNELAWLATLDDVESRIVFVERGKTRTSYSVETGPFDDDYLNRLPRRDWTLLVHDVEKHIPAMRQLFDAVPFVPDWRIDDLMVSFAAPGGGVGPHLDNYDVFLCQGTGVRDWRFTSDVVAEDSNASNDIALLSEFDGESFACSQGDVLYLPPGVAHWGTAKRACLTYSIGMRAPLIADIALLMGLSMSDDEEFYCDPDLSVDEVNAGYISPHAVQRVAASLALTQNESPKVAIALGKLCTQTKDWLRPDCPTSDEAEMLATNWALGMPLALHGMARLAFDDNHLYINGESTPYAAELGPLIVELSQQRVALSTPDCGQASIDIVAWMLLHGAFDLPEIR